MMTSHLGGETLVIFADGAVKAQRAGAGIVVVHGRQIIALENRGLPLMTNNEAEYVGLQMALEKAAVLAAQQVEIRLDSEVVVGQMSGRWAVNSVKLKQAHQAACELARCLPQVTYIYIPRQRNALADALAAEAAAGRQWRGGWNRQRKE